MSKFAKWEFVTDSIDLICYRCSHCGFVAREDEIDSLYSSRCPECGSIMIDSLEED